MRFDGASRTVEWGRIAAGRPDVRASGREPARVERRLVSGRIANRRGPCLARGSGGAGAGVALARLGRAVRRRPRGAVDLRWPPAGDAVRRRRRHRGRRRGRHSRRRLGAIPNRKWRTARRRNARRQQRSSSCRCSATPATGRRSRTCRPKCDSTDGVSTCAWNRDASSDWTSARAGSPSKTWAPRRRWRRSRPVSRARAPTSCASSPRALCGHGSRRRSTTSRYTATAPSTWSLRFPWTGTAGRITVDGRIALDDNRIDVPGLHQGLAAVNGTIVFDGASVESDGITATWLGEPLRAVIGASPEVPDATRLLVHGRLTPRLLAAYLHDAGLVETTRPGDSPLLARVRGEAAWNAALDVPHAGGTRPVKLHIASDLAGLSLDLPPPFGKAKGVARHCSASAAMSPPVWKASPRSATATLRVRRCGLSGTGTPADSGSSAARSVSAPATRRFPTRPA